MRSNIKICLTLLYSVMVMYLIFVPVNVKAATKRLEKVENVCVKSSDYNAISITWQKCKGAKKYQIYRATSKNGKYRLIKTTSKIKYVNKGLITGKKYFYKIRAINGLKKGKFCSRKMAQPTLKTVSINNIMSGDQSIRIKYKKIKGANGYQIYRSSKVDGQYIEIGKCKTLIFNDENLNTGETYYYKVRAYRKVGKTYKYGSFSEIKFCKVILSAPEVHVERGNGEIKIFWNSIKSAEGYQVYRSEKRDGQYKLLSDTTNICYQDTTPEIPKTYYYKVCAYMIINGNVEKGKFSEEKGERVIQSEKKVTIDGVTFGISADKSHSFEKIVTLEDGSRNYSEYINMNSSTISTVCPFDKTCNSSTTIISIVPNREIDYNDISFVIDDNGGLMGPSEVIDIDGNAVFSDEKKGFYYMASNWNNPIAKVFAYYSPKIEIWLYGINKGEFPIKVYYKNQLLYQCNFVNGYVDVEAMKYRTFINEITNEVWDFEKTALENFENLCDFIKTEFTYGEIRCTEGATIVGYVARGLGFDARYQFAYEDKYDYHSAYTIGGHVSTIVKIDGTDYLFDAQGHYE